MERPSINDYNLSTTESKVYSNKLVPDLEKYIDEIESELQKYKKALNGACEELQHLILSGNMQYEPEEWKEILLEQAEQ